MAIFVALSLPGLVRAQPSTNAAPVIRLHPRVPTILQLPDEIEHARIFDRDDIRFAIVGDELYLRPWPGTPAGLEALLEVETRTARWTFRLRVVARVRDARRDILVAPAEAQARGESMPEVRPDTSVEPVAPPEVPAEAVAPEAGEPASSRLRNPPSPAPPDPMVGPASAGEPRSAAVIPTVLRTPRSEISVHAIGSLGFTSLDIAGYAPFTSRQSHLGFGVRLRVSRPDAWWAVEANIVGERPSGAVTFVDPDQRFPQLAMKGTWLRAEVGLRARLGTKWSPSVYVGPGVQAHLRRTESVRGGSGFSETMPRGAVLVLGIGLQRRAENLLLGLDFQVREGGPDGYHSAALFWTIGCNLDPD